MTTIYVSDKDKVGATRLAPASLGSKPHARGARCVQGYPEGTAEGGSALTRRVPRANQHRSAASFGFREVRSSFCSRCWDGRSALPAHRGVRRWAIASTPATSGQARNGESAWNRTLLPKGGHFPYGSDHLFRNRSAAIRHAQRAASGCRRISSPSSP